MIRSLGAPAPRRSSAGLRLQRFGKLLRQLRRAGDLPVTPHVGAAGALERMVISNGFALPRTPFTLRSRDRGASIAREVTRWTDPIWTRRMRRR